MDLTGATADRASPSTSPSGAARSPVVGHPHRRGHPPGASPMAFLTMAADPPVGPGDRILRA